MAFLFLSDKKPSFGPTNLNNASPGPGQYIAHQDIKADRGYAPFLSTVERGIVKKVKSTTPGPGSYDAQLSIENSLKTNKPYHATLAPNPEQTETTNLSTAFKSKSRRFEYKIDTEMPGPGKYYKDLAFSKSKSVSNLHSRATFESPVAQLLREERIVVPSIPSYKHSYGYSEQDHRKLALNKNPLIEIQEFVGPGYYDIKDTMSTESNKGTTWHKSASKRFESQAAKLPTKNVGPGSYEAVNPDGVMPKYKTKASSGFASTTGRTFAGKDKTKPTLAHSQSTGQFAIGFDVGKISDIFEGNQEEANYHTDESLPGPGQYHNEALVSSLKLNYKPTQLQFFGSGTERFKQDAIAAEPLGPGEYNPDRTSAKKLDKQGKEMQVTASVPFQSTGMRFAAITPSLGPGVYEPKVNLVDRVNDKARRGYLGSFGSTEMRFRPKKVPEETPEQIKHREKEFNKPPELSDEQKKNSHYFVSKTNKVTVSYKPPEIPPPGAYEGNYYDLGRRATESESYFFISKKTPFNSSQPRFKYKDAEDQPVPLSDERFNLKKNVVVRTKNNPSSVFNSQSKRATTTGSNKNGMPGPGTYQTTGGWMKRSYNVRFLDN